MMVMMMMMIMLMMMMIIILKIIIVIAVPIVRLVCVVMSSTPWLMSFHCRSQGTPSQGRVPRGTDMGAVLHSYNVGSPYYGSDYSTCPCMNLMPCPKGHPCRRELT